MVWVGGIAEEWIQFLFNSATWFSVPVRKQHRWEKQAYILGTDNSSCTFLENVEFLAFCPFCFTGSLCECGVLCGFFPRRFNWMIENLIGWIWRDKSVTEFIEICLKMCWFCDYWIVWIVFWCWNIKGYNISFVLTVKLASVLVILWEQGSMRLA